MKKIWVFALTILLVLSFTGCDFTKLSFTSRITGSNGRITVGENSKVHTDIEGIYLLIDSAEKKDTETSLFATWHNETDYEITYYAPYSIEYNDNGEWKECWIADVDFIEIAYTLPSKSTANRSYTTKWFDISNPGLYRLRTNCHAHDGDSVTSCVVWCEFSVK